MYGNKILRLKGVQLFSEKNGKPLSTQSYAFLVKLWITCSGYKGWVWIFRTGGGVRVSFTRGRSSLSLVIITFAYQWEEAPSLWCHQGLDKFKKHINERIGSIHLQSTWKALHDCFLFPRIWSLFHKKNYHSALFWHRGL